MVDRARPDVSDVLAVVETCWVSGVAARGGAVIRWGACVRSGGSCYQWHAPAEQRPAGVPEAAARRLADAPEQPTGASGG